MTEAAADLLAVHHPDRTRYPWLSDELAVEYRRSPHKDSVVVGRQTITVAAVQVGSDRWKGVWEGGHTCGDYRTWRLALAHARAEAAMAAGR